MKYLNVLQQAIVFIITIFWIYNIGISVCSLIKFKDKPLKTNKKHKFMAIIPAHNEAAVVANLVKSLKEQNYPKELLDIYVIADNCTDNTAEIAKEAGAIVYERFDATKKTKGYAMQWFLKQKIEENADYDAFCVFDADNVAMPDFIKNMNKKLCQGEEVVQGYRDIKNPTDNWITAGYALFYWTMHRFYHLARYNVGLSPLLNGTGFMVKFDVIKPNGWQTETLTEDIEFSLINMCQGRKLGWATDAVVFDEQPTGFKQSWTQRMRWSVGHIQCFKIYTKQLAKNAIKNRKMVTFDGFLYLMGMPLLIITLSLLLLNVIIFSGHGMTGAELAWNIGRYVFATFLLTPLSAAFAMILDKRKIKPMLKGLLCYPAFMGSWILINIKALIKPNTTWEKIEHVRSIDVKELS